MTKSFQSIKKYRSFLSYLAKNSGIKILIAIAIVFITQTSPVFAQDFSYELVAAGTQSPYESKEFPKDIPYFSP